MTIQIDGASVYNFKSKKTEIRTLYIQDGIFVEGLDREPDLLIDGYGLTALPGLVDAHVHLRDPGYEYREDIVTGTRSAAKCGCTAVAFMPNTKPVCDNAAIVRYIIDKAEAEGACRVFPVGAVSKGQRGEEITEMGLMAESGAVAFSDDGLPVAKASLMRKAMLYANQFDRFIISHCEDLSLVDEGSMNEGSVATELGLRGIPSTSEDAIVAREILLSEYLGLHVHLAHISTARSVEMIRDAKARGIKITAETCPHYFTLTDDACRGYDTNTKMNPPLRREVDRLAIIEGLRDGTLDMIVTDHAPHHLDEKDCEFAVANNGIIGLETSFSLSYTYLVRENVMTLAELLDRMSFKPSELLKLPLNTLDVNTTANMTLVDLEQPYTYDVSQSLSKAHNTPFDGWVLYGEPKLTILEGRITYRK